MKLKKILFCTIALILVAQVTVTVGKIFYEDTLIEQARDLGFKYARWRIELNTKKIPSPTKNERVKKGNQ